MEYILVIFLAVLVFGVCFLIDKGFTKLFRSQEQHRSGLSVRFSKRYGSMGLIIAVLGVAAVFAGLSDGWVLLAGGILLIAVGLGLVVHYLSFGVFYNDDTFLITTFRGGTKTYSYGQIKNQQLYNSQGNIVIELHMDDGSTVQLQSTMTGVYPFLDKAFAAWLAQTGREEADCPFYDPSNSCWFPPVEV